MGRSPGLPTAGPAVSGRASYTEMISWLGGGGITTRRMLEEILAVEDEHAEDMLSFLQTMG